MTGVGQADIDAAGDTDIILCGNLKLAYCIKRIGWNC
jgi:hypothetical protein